MAPDRFGNPDSAFRFDGIDDYIEVPDTGSFNFRFPVTLTAWIDLDDEDDVPATSNQGTGTAVLLLLTVRARLRLFPVLPRESRYQVWHVAAAVPPCVR